LPGTRRRRFDADKNYFGTKTLAEREELRHVSRSPRAGRFGIGAPFESLTRAKQLARSSVAMNNEARDRGLLLLVAEREGFEPPVR